jgi:hypothetical protein
MKQAKRPDVTGLDGRRPRRPGTIHPIRQAPDRGDIRYDEVASCPDQGPIDAVPRPWLAPDMEGSELATMVAHRRSIARPQVRVGPTFSSRRT